MNTDTLQTQQAQNVPPERSQTKRRSYPQNVPLGHEININNVLF
jgi:hypothetical protein